MLRAEKFLHNLPKDDPMRIAAEPRIAKEERTTQLKLRQEREKESILDYQTRLQQIKESGLEEPALSDQIKALDAEHLENMQGIKEEYLGTDDDTDKDAVSIEDIAKVHEDARIWKDEQLALGELHPDIIEEQMALMIRGTLESMGALPSGGGDGGGGVKGDIYRMHMERETKVFHDRQALLTAQRASGDMDDTTYFGEMAKAVGDLQAEDERTWDEFVLGRGGREYPLSWNVWEDKWRPIVFAGFKSLKYDDAEANRLTDIVGVENGLRNSNFDSIKLGAKTLLEKVPELEGLPNHKLISLTQAAIEAEKTTSEEIKEVESWPTRLRNVLNNDIMSPKQKSDTVRNIMRNDSIKSLEGGVDRQNTLHALVDGHDALYVLQEIWFALESDNAPLDSGRIPDLREKIYKLIGAEPEDTDLVSAESFVRKLLNATIKKLSGVAVSAQEAKRLEKEWPQIWGHPERIRAELDGLIKYAEFAINQEFSSYGPIGIGYLYTDPKYFGPNIPRTRPGASEAWGMVSEIDDEELSPEEQVDFDRLMEGTE